MTANYSENLNDKNLSTDNEENLTNHKKTFKKKIPNIYANAEISEQIISELEKNNQELIHTDFISSPILPIDEKEYQDFKESIKKRMKEKEEEEKKEKIARHEQRLKEQKERALLLEQEREKQEKFNKLKYEKEKQFYQQWNEHEIDGFMGMFFNHNKEINSVSHISYEDMKRKKAEEIKKEKELLENLSRKFNKFSNEYENTTLNIDNSAKLINTPSKNIVNYNEENIIVKNKEKEKTSLFKKIGNYVQSYWKKEEIQLSPEEQALKDKVDRLINNLILPEVYRLRKNGIELSQEQHDKFDYQLSQLIHEGKSEQLKEMLAEGYTPRKELLADWLAYHSEKEEIKELFNHELKQVWDNKEVIDLILELRIQKLKELITITSQRRIMEHPHEHSIIIEKQKSEQYQLRQNLNQEMEKLLNLYTSMKKILNIDLYTYILDLFSELNEKENLFHKLYKSTRRPVYSPRPGSLNSNVIENLEEQSKEIEEKMRSQINHFYKTINEKMIKPFKVELMHYPKEIQDKLISLQFKIEECKKEQENMTEHEWERLEGLWTNILNKSLIAYLEMSDKHRRELLSVENKTPQHLLSETITHIDELIESKLLEINEQRLHSLSVTQRYAQTIKKNF